jgi:hypothetical protein
MNTTMTAQAISSGSFAERVVAAIFACVDRQKLTGNPSALSRSVITPLMIEEVRQLDEARTPSGTKSKGRKAVVGPFGNRKTIPPTPAQVTAYSASIGYPMDGEKWCDFYAAKGWSVGKNRMKDWQAAVRNWKTNHWGHGSVALTPRKPSAAQDYTKI